jgi:hypothetical protein
MYINKNQFINASCLVLIVLLSSFVAVTGANAIEFPKKLAPSTTINVTSTEPDVIATVSESYVNRVLQSELEKRNPPGVKQVSVAFKENEPVEITAVIEIPLVIRNAEQEVIVEANVSAANDTLKVEPVYLKVGMLNLPKDSWIGPINTMMKTVEDSVNMAAQDVLQKGYEITDVVVGDNQITLSINAPTQLPIG